MDMDSDQGVFPPRPFDGGMPTSLAGSDVGFDTVSSDWIMASTFFGLRSKGAAMMRSKRDCHLRRWGVTDLYE